MNDLTLLHALVGEWRSTYRVLLPGEPPFESTSHATITPILGGKFVRIDYTWAFKETPHEGVLTFGHDAQADEATVVWIDSWHMSDKFLVSQGTVDDKGVINVLGAFAVGEGPDWGWRTIIIPDDGRGWRMEMYNIEPHSREEMLGVEADYSKQ